MKKPNWQKFKLEKKYSLSLIVLILIGLGVYFFVFNSENKETIIVDPVEIIEEMKCDFQHFLDGSCLEEGLKDNFVYAVMIENHNQARPLSGINQAKLVYETVVEFPITRFIAFYSNEQEVKEIGPVRSARPFYVEWAKTFNSYYAHVGGSPDGLDRIDELNLPDLDEFYNFLYYWRSSRSAPHNVYLSSNLVNKAWQQSNISVEQNLVSWNYKEDQGVDMTDPLVQVEDIYVNFGNKGYDVTWKYNSEENNYVRYQNNSVYKDKTGEETKAKNIVLIYTDIKVIDDYGRREIRTLGEGKAKFYQDGQEFLVTWQKVDYSDRLKLIKEDGQEVEFNRGTTWVEVLENSYYEN